MLHPFDAKHGVETSGYVPPERLPRSSFVKKANYIYAGSQPGIVRAALEALPSLEGYTFVDLGCGKGRPMLVASEFPFKELIGVELSDELAETARRNIVRFSARYPSRPPMRAQTGDAVLFPHPQGNLVIFLYNPFGEEVMRHVIAAIEMALDTEPRSVFVVYYNPLWSGCMDHSPRLKRYFAAALPYAPEEIGFGPDTADSVVIWQGGSSFPPHSGADATITVTVSGSRAEVKA